MPFLNRLIPKRLCAGLHHLPNETDRHSGDDSRSRLSSELSQAQEINSLNKRLGLLKQTSILLGFLENRVPYGLQQCRSGVFKTLIEPRVEGNNDIPCTARSIGFLAGILVKR